MTQQWKVTTEATQITHHIQHDAGDENAVKATLEACIEKAVSLLDDNVQDDAMYLLFGWQEENGSAQLRVSVADATKSADAKQVVCGEFSVLPAGIDAEQVAFWLRDYLTTCTAFLRWSLLAAFYTDDRARAQLL